MCAENLQNKKISAVEVSNDAVSKFDAGAKKLLSDDVNEQVSCNCFESINPSCFLPTRALYAPHTRALVPVVTPSHAYTGSARAQNSYLIAFVHD